MDRTTNQERVDQIEKYYNPIEKCDRWVKSLFWLSALLSVVVPYSDHIPVNWAQQISGVFFVIVVVAYSVSTHYKGFFLIPVAEEMRRKQLLSNAFGIPLTPERTSGYYNNELLPSIARLGACVLENAFFAKSVCHEMAKKERKKIFIYSLLWVAAIAWRSTDLGIVLVVTQVLFSGEILVYCIKVEVLRFRINTIYNDLYSHFLHQRSPNQNLGIADILDSFASYESAKIAASIKQSSKIFHRLNPKLSEEWNDIRRQLHID